MAADPSKLVISPHADGLARLTFSPDGHYLYTCGYEGLMRIFDSRLDVDNTVEPAVIEFHEDAVVSISATNDLFASASESGQVVLHEAGSTDLEGFLTRFSLPARSVRFDPRGKRAVVTSDEVIAKVIDVKDKTKVQVLTGHSRSIREASWSPDGQFVTTSSVDGTIRVWQLDAGTEPTCVQVIDGIITAEDADSEYSVEVIWHPAGKFFVVASKDNDIAVVSRETWQKTGTFSLKEGGGRVSSLAFSANGLYLASASLAGDLLVWSVKDRKVVSRTPHAHGLITSLAFHPAPTANSLAYIDNKGQLTRWQNPVPTDLPAPTHARAPPAPKEAVAKKASAQNGGRRRSDSASTSTSSHAGGEDGNKKGALFRKDQASDDEFGDLDLGDDWLEDDIGDRLEGELDAVDVDGADEHDPFADDVPVPGMDGGRNGPAGFSRARSAPIAGKAYGVQRGQAPFQPGATPWREKRRYLAFNMIGFISAVDRDESQSVTIDFHDRSSHVATKFEDKMKYDKASLGELGAIFSCPAVDDHPAQLFYKPYQSWTSLVSWPMSLLAGEQVTALALGGGGLSSTDALAFDDPTVGLGGSGTALVATSRGFVRFISGAGLQKYVWNVGEEVVALAAARDWAVIVHRASGGAAGLEYALVDTDTFEFVQQGKVPLVHGTSLAWIGFSNDGIPVMYDSAGMLSILDRSRRPRQARWVPALDTQSLARREGKQEAYWPVGVTEQQLHVVILKGGEQHPHFPTPLLQELDLQFPLLSMDVPAGQLAEKHLRESLFVQHRKDGAPADDYSLKTELAREEVQVDKHMLLAIQAFCKADKLEAALDAVLLLTQPASLIAASKVAGFFTLPALQERIELVQQMRDDAADPDEAALKRQSKWAHLVDDRYVSAGGVPSAASHSRGGMAAPAAADLFAPRAPTGTPAFGTAQRRSFGTPSASATPASSSRAFGSAAVPSSKKRKSFANGAGVSMAGSDGAEMQLDGEDDDEDERGGLVLGGEDEPVSSPKRMRLGSDEPEELDDEDLEEHEARPPPPKKALNPFAKRPAVPKPAPAPAANPFADKKAGKAKDLGRTDSFFHRVEGKEAPAPKAKGKGKAASAASSTSTKKGKEVVSSGAKQLTLFGAPPPGAKADSATKASSNKKRKASAAPPTEVTAPTPSATLSTSATTTAGSSSSSSTSKLDAFRHKPKPGSAAAAGLGASVGARELPREGEDMEETQVVDETQDDEPVGLARERSELRTVREETEGAAARGEDETQEDTQMTETQVETQPATASPSSHKENARPSPAAQLDSAQAAAPKPAGTDASPSPADDEA
ncbi:hypothetical protein JCM3775_002099 [Rhodotorula graminis]